MLLRIGTFVLALCGVIGCAPLPPAFPEDISATETLDTVSSVDAAPAPVDNVATIDTAVTVAPSPQLSDTQAPIVARTLPASLRRPLRIGLSFGKRTHRISGQGEWIAETDTGRRLILRESATLVWANGQVHVRGSDNAWLCSGLHITLHPADGSATLRVDGKGYRGSFEFTAQDNGMRTVNIVHTEDYLKGVVPHEIGKLDATGIEALKAQAVAARTYAFRHFNSRSSQGFDMYADVRDQVYEGRDGEYNLANQAVEATRGVVMQFDGKLIDAYYHSTSAGRTESVAAWDRSDLPYLRSVLDVDSQGRPWCSESSYMQWKQRISDADLVALVRKNASQAKADRVFSFSEVRSIEIRNRLPGGRVGDLFVHTDQGSLRVKGDRTRWLFKQGAKILPSANFEVSHVDGTWIFSGKGLGHGIGMCQMGARGRSRAGQNYPDILRHYYQGIDLISYQD